MWAPPANDSFQGGNRFVYLRDWSVYPYYIVAMLISFKQLTTEFNREPPIRWQIAEKRYGMLREPQHERNFLNHFEPLSVRPEPVEGLRESFSATC
jgi:hypothetical protein